MLNFLLYFTYTMRHKTANESISLFQLGFTLGNVVGMYLAQNYEVSFKIIFILLFFHFNFLISVLTLILI